jgi:hypothetical protein
LTSALLFFAAIFIGFIASMIGVGGGIFMVPLLAFFFVETTQEAIGTSLAAIIFTSISSSIAYRNVINKKLGLVLMPTTIAGAWLGAMATRYVSSAALSIAFGILMLYPAGMMIKGKEPKEIAKFFSNRSGNLLTMAPFIGVAAGMASGFLGIGGGIVMVPTLTILGIDIVVAVATSLFVMAPSASLAAWQHWRQQNLHPQLAIPLILGIIIGAQIGPRISTRMPKVRLRQLFGLVLLYSAFNMIWKGVT